ncbi:HAD family hydrolase [Pilimelia columellifera]
MTATNVAFASVDAPPVTPDDHRRRFRRPIVDYYGEVLGRVVTPEEFAQLDRIFHDAYRQGLVNAALAADAEHAMRSWPGGQSLLSMWFHDELVPLVHGFGLQSLLARIDGLRATVGGGPKAGHLAEHLVALGLSGGQVVLIGDSLDDADAAEAVGAGCVLYTGGLTHPELLAARGVPVATTLVEAVRLAARLD